MTRRPAWLLATGLAYLGLTASLFTGVYHPFIVGSDRGGLIYVVIAAAHLGLGASWRTRWNLALPGLPAVALVIAFHDGFSPIVAVYSGIAGLIGVALVLVGRGLGWLARRHGERAAVLAPAVLFLVACGPLGKAALESHHLATGPRLSPGEAARLPLDEGSLNGLCPTPVPDPDVDRDELRAQGAALLAATRRHPDSIVTAGFAFADEDDPGGGHERMTVRQLAQEQLDVLRHSGNCAPRLQRALADAIG